MPVPLHTTGKASFDDIYSRPDPRDYYARMSELDYRIPELAKPHLRRQIAECGAAKGAAPGVLDIGCSYGVNAALLRWDTTLAELAGWYADPEAETNELIARDRARPAGADALPGVRFLGMDASAPALDYARAAGLLDAVVHADLEATDPSDEQRAILASADLVVSTGCIGYVTEKTIVRIATAHPDRRPWMAHFVLRMYGFEPIEAELAALGYHTRRMPGEFAQRRFASVAEREQVLSTLTGNGIDTTGLENEGWLYANLYVSRPLSAPISIA
ncbi:class I SAM-dependent methyltransferase [Nocardia rhamnosiphila]|uniref:Class I SAM-dependent methyltransferase n=1 Tax=Nocardia rhamnosiphila TaxID=426716 RepID=A0ABV2WHW8_9NOCA|nr:class I SAM-dependent methyltransferase [Nocardia rhamnosiphila]